MLTALRSGRMPERRAVFKSVHIKKSGIYAASKVFYEESSKTYRKCVWYKRVAYMPQITPIVHRVKSSQIASLDKKERHICRNNACYKELLKVCECVVELKRVAHMP